MGLWVFASARELLLFGRSDIGIGLVVATCGKRNDQNGIMKHIRVEVRSVFNGDRRSSLTDQF